MGGKGGGVIDLKELFRRVSVNSDVMYYNPISLAMKSSNFRPQKGTIRIGDFLEWVDMQGWVCKGLDIQEGLLQFACNIQIQSFM